MGTKKVLRLLARAYYPRDIVFLLSHLSQGSPFTIGFERGCERNIGCFGENVAYFGGNVACFEENVAYFGGNVAYFWGNVACFAPKMGGVTANLGEIGMLHTSIQLRTRHLPSL